MCIYIYICISLSFFISTHTHKYTWICNICRQMCTCIITNLHRWECLKIGTPLILFPVCKNKVSRKGKGKQHVSLISSMLRQHCIRVYKLNRCQLPTKENIAICNPIFVGVRSRLRTTQTKLDIIVWISTTAQRLWLTGVWSISTKK